MVNQHWSSSESRPSSLKDLQKINFGFLEDAYVHNMYKVCEFLVAPWSEVEFRRWKSWTQKFNFKRYHNSSMTATKVTLFCTHRMILKKKNYIDCWVILKFNAQFWDFCYGKIMTFIWKKYRVENWTLWNNFNGPKTIPPFITFFFAFFLFLFWPVKIAYLFY